MKIEPWVFTMFSWHSSPQGKQHRIKLSLLSASLMTKNNVTGGLTATHWNSENTAIGYLAGGGMLCWQSASELIGILG